MTQWVDARGGLWHWQHAEDKTVWWGENSRNHYWLSFRQWAGNNLKFDSNKLLEPSQILAQGLWLNLEVEGRLFELEVGKKEMSIE